MYFHSLGNTNICNQIDIVCIFLGMYCINVCWRKELIVSPANNIISPRTKAWTSGRSSGSPFSFVWTRGPAVTQDVNLNMEGNHLALDVKDLRLHRYDGASDRMGTFCETGKSWNQMSLETQTEMNSESVSMMKSLCFKSVIGRIWRREYFFETTLEYCCYYIKAHLHMIEKLYTQPTYDTKYVYGLREWMNNIPCISDITYSVRVITCDMWGMTCMWYENEVTIVTLTKLVNHIFAGLYVTTKEMYEECFEANTYMHKS